MRTQDEIVVRMRNSRSFLGFEMEVLITALDFEHAKEFLRPEVKAEDWKCSDEQTLLSEAQIYAAFAWGKAADHRGISAGRGVEKLSAVAWLLGRDDVVSAMAAVDYAYYGCPKLKAFCEGMCFPIGTGAALERMMKGEPCSDGCDSCC
jgi:hypothetical protein